MGASIVELPQVGPVHIYRRRSARHLRLSIDAHGHVRVSIPYYVSRRNAIQFVQTQAEWIRRHQTKPKLLQPGDRIGKAHRLQFSSQPELSHPQSHISGNKISVSLPARIEFDDASAQTVASQACIRALREQAQLLLPQRVTQLARRYGFSYRDVRIRQMKSRWGSCNSHRQISLNLFLVQLPWDLIDYVIVHELVHTKILRHGAPFWQELEQHVPQASTKRQKLKQYNATLIAT